VPTCGNGRAHPDLDAGSVPDSALTCAPVRHVAERAARSLLAGVVDSVETHFAGAESAVLPILDYVLARAEEISHNRAHRRWGSKRVQHWADSSDWQCNRRQEAIQRFAPSPIHFMIDSWKNRSLRLDADPFEYP
jgi:hypothetical protein